MNTMTEMAVEHTRANDMPQPDDHLLRVVERHDELRCCSTYWRMTLSDAPPQDAEK